MESWTRLDSGFRPHLERDVQRLKAAGIPARLIDIVDPEDPNENPLTATVLEVPHGDEREARELLDLPSDNAPLEDVDTGDGFRRFSEWLVAVGLIALGGYFLTVAILAEGVSRPVLLVLALFLLWVGFHSVRSLRTAPPDEADGPGS